MRKKHYNLLYTVILVIVLTACSGGTYYTVPYTRNLYYGGKYNEALKVFDDSKAPKEDILYKFEYGAAAQAAGEYRKSIDVFNSAQPLIKQQETISVNQTFLDLTITDAATEYKPSFYEKYLYHMLNEINYIIISKYDDAMAEAKMSLENLAAYEEKFGHMGIIHYMAGLCFELNGQINDAYIEYKKFYDSNRGFTDILPKLKKMSYFINLKEDYEKWDRLLKTADNTDKDIDNKAEAIFIIMKGHAPIKSNYTVLVAADQKISIPYYKSFGMDTSKSNINVDGNIYETNVMLDLKDIIKGLNNKELMKNILKETTRLMSRKAVENQTENKYGKNTTEVMKYLLFFLLQPDMRTWQTLADSFQVKSIYLDKGRHSVKIDNKVSIEIDINDNKPHLYCFRLI